MSSFDPEDPDRFYHEVVSRFHEVNRPKTQVPEDPDRSGAKLHRVTARIPDSTVYQADKIARLLNYSRNEVIIQALGEYCLHAEMAIQSFASDQQINGGDDHYLNVFEEQRDLFDGEK